MSFSFVFGPPELLRLRSALRRGALLLAVFALFLWMGEFPRSVDGVDPSEAAKPDGAGVEPWRELRVQMRLADKARREHQFPLALGLYRAVAQSPLARDDDRVHSAYWGARMRLERGEWSALVEFDLLLERRLEPAQIARLVGALGRARGDDGPVEYQEHLVKLLERCHRELRRMASVHDENGERARRWVAKFEKQLNLVQQPRARRAEMR